MTLHLSPEQLSITNEYFTSEITPILPVDSNLPYNEVDRTHYNTSQNNSSLMPENSGSTHEYELNKSDSLTFLQNLLYDDHSGLSKTDILNILNSLKRRESKLPFSVTQGTKSNETDIQGIQWPHGLWRKFQLDRKRVGNQHWFYNVNGSRQDALSSNDITSSYSKTDFYHFQKFFSKLKIHITHFQLRNLVCCGPKLSNGIFYPSSYLSNHHSMVEYNDMLDITEDYQRFFKINRLMPDNMSVNDGSMKLDCLIDSRTLTPNNRISTMACSNSLLACGTFEGGYLLQDIRNPDKTKLIGEYTLTNSADGITNHIVIHDENKLTISLNDKSLIFIDTESKVRDTLNLPFSVNCVSLNPSNSSEILITGDHINSFMIDKRVPIPSNFLNCSSKFVGHRDFGFSCDWSPTNENLLVTGNQDGSVKLWDRRVYGKCLHSWNGSLGTGDEDEIAGGPVRNTKFSHNGEFLCWAESLDHIGIIPVDDLKRSPNVKPRVQSIDFIGKCIGLNFVPSESGYGEHLVIGVNDCPLGGILKYKLDSRNKCLDFDFDF